MSLAKPPKPLPDDFWEREKLILRAIFQPRLASMTYSAMTAAATLVGIAFDGAAYNAYAERYAAERTDMLLRGFVSADLLDAAPAGGAEYGTFVQGTGQIIADWIAREGATVGELNDALRQMYSPARASAIAVTETTRAFASGQRQAYAAEGIKRWQWSTNRDDLVCPVCGPLNNKTVAIGESFANDQKLGAITQPPAHPNCRCWVRPVR